jgi:methanogenic corrinoid protein MtbC1
MVRKPVVAWYPRPATVAGNGTGGAVPRPWIRDPSAVAARASSPPIVLPHPPVTPAPLRATPAPAPADELRDLLARAVEAEVVPRLVLARRASAAAADAARAVCGPTPEDEAPGPEDVVALVALALTSDAPTAIAFCDAVRARGVTLERLYLDLLAPAARRIGQLWVDDLCSFADVTMALGRLQQVLRALSPAFMPGAGVRDRRRRAALVPMPGEQHTFGLAMVTEFFLRAGWDVWSEPSATAEELNRLVGAQWFAVVGLSVSCESRIDQVPGVIRSVRRASRNPAVGVMVGGRVFAERPELAGQVGADATAVDGRQAALQAETLLALLASRAPG